MPRLRGHEEHCSTVSTTVSSRFSIYEEDGQEEEDVEEREKKFVPVSVKSEVLENEDKNETEDEFVNIFNCDKEEDEDYHPGKVGAKSKGVKKRIPGNKTKGGSSSKMSSKTIRVKGKRPPTMTPEEKREKQNERKRQYRLREKERQEELQGIVANAEDHVGKTNTESFEEKKESGEMTPKKGKRTRAQGQVQRKQTKEHMSIVAIKKELVSDGEEKDNKDNDEDYQPGKDEDDEDWGKKATKKTAGKKRRHRVTPEEKRATDRERKRRWRLKQKQMLEQQMQGQGSSDNVEVKRMSGRATSAAGGGGEQRKKKRISDMTPEEAEKVRAQWREERRKRRARERQLMKWTTATESEGDDERKISTSGGQKQISEMTDEEKEELRAKLMAQREKRKQRGEEVPLEVKLEDLVKPKRIRPKRSLKAVGLTEEERRRVEEQYRKDRERKRAKRAAMTPEEKQELWKRTYMNRLMKMATLSEDEQKMIKLQRYIQNAAYSAKRTMTPEQLQRKRDAQRERARQKRELIRSDPAKLEMDRQLKRWYWHNMPSERKQRIATKLKENYKKRLEEAKRDPEKLAQWKEKLKENNMKRTQRLRELRGEAPEKRERKPRKRKEKPKKEKPTPLTEEEKKERRSLYRRRWLTRKRLKIQQLLESGMSIMEIHEKKNSPEKRERRCIRVRRNKARADLRARLRAAGASQQEIDEKVKELNATYQPVMQFRPYKPRPDMRKRVDPSELALLGVDVPKEGELQSALLTTPAKPTPTSSDTSKKIKATPSSAAAAVAITPITEQHSKIVRATSAKLKQQVTSSTSAPIAYQSVIQLQNISASVNTSYHHPHQQHYNSPYHSIHHTNQSHYQNTITHVYPHQQQQQQPAAHSNQSYSLQSVWDGIASHHQPGGIMVISSSTGHQYTTGGDTTSTTSSVYHQTEYGSSYGGDDDDRGNNFSPPPPSPPHRKEDQDAKDLKIISSTGYYNNNQSCPRNRTVSSNNAASVALKKYLKKKNRKPTPYKPRPGAVRRTKRSEVIRDVVCDECGQVFNRFTLRGHQNVAHNPNFDYKTKTCLICNVRFRVSNRWYTHYLRDHVRPAQEPEKKSEICPECGKTFKSIETFRAHHYYAHGEGTKRENYHRCLVCPQERLFKVLSGLQIHMRRNHPGYKHGTEDHKCYRCGDDFPNDRELEEHVRIRHPESYFCCEFCGTKRFSRLGMNFHYDRCTKISRAARHEKVTSWNDGVYSMQRVQIKCRYCERGMNMSCLRKHYKVVHGVVEDKKFGCPNCKKEFKRREYLVVHLEEVHCKPVVENDEMWESLRKVNADNMEGLKLEGHRTGRSSSGGGKGTKGKSRGKKSSDKKQGADTENEEADECTDNEDSLLSAPMEEAGASRRKGGGGGGGGRRKRRNILVICEEEEEEEASRKVENNQQD